MGAPKEFTEEWVLDRSIPVTETGCWLWTLGEARGGYGKSWRDGKSVIAHRAIWEAKYGRLPRHLVVCHKCDTRLCVNVDHLFVGTHKDNSADMVSKSRQAKGEKSGKSKMTDELVLSIRKASGKHSDVAMRFGLKEGNVRLIRLGVTWKHLLSA